MNNYLFLLVLTFAFFSCNNHEKELKKPLVQENLTQVKDGVFTEWYPGKKQIKFQGGQDDNKRRDGVWTFYAEDGTELSVTVYKNGLREGHTIVKYPNGAIHYRGEYQNDKTVGVWTTYDEKGKFVSETDFGYPEH